MHLKSSKALQQSIKRMGKLPKLFAKEDADEKERLEKIKELGADAAYKNGTNDMFIKGQKLMTSIDFDKAQTHINNMLEERLGLHKKPDNVPNPPPLPSEDFNKAKKHINKMLEGRLIMRTKSKNISPGNNIKSKLTNNDSKEEMPDFQTRMNFLEHKLKI